jgi:[protein-PII] uridylyltransferase
VLDIFRVTTTRFEAVEDARDQQRVEKLLTEALQGENYDFMPLLEKRLRRLQQWERTLDFPTRLTINTEANPNYTVVDIATPDRLGLLYDILRTVSDAQFLVAAARITTEKGAAIDSFYITDLEGVKVTSSERLARLGRALSKACEARVIAAAT